MPAPVSTSGPAESPARCSKESTRACSCSGPTSTSARATWSTPTRARRSRTPAARPPNTARWDPPSARRNRNAPAVDLPGATAADSSPTSPTPCAESTASSRFTFSVPTRSAQPPASLGNSGPGSRESAPARTSVSTSLRHGMTAAAAALACDAATRPAAVYPVHASLCRRPELTDGSRGGALGSAVSAPRQAAPTASIMLPYTARPAPLGVSSERARRPFAALSGDGRSRARTGDLLLVRQAL
jgi:hypothetical protein